MSFELYHSSSAQKRLYLLRELMGKTTAYNLPYALIIEGSVEAKAIEDVFLKLIERHEALRTGFLLDDEGEVLQQVYTELPFTLRTRECVGKGIDEIITEFIQPFELSEPPLLRVELIKLEERRHLLLFDIDHIVTDGQSNLILVKEFIALYQGKELPEVEVQYVDFALWQNQMLESGAIKDQEDYWLEIFKQAVAPLNLPTDYERPERLQAVGDHFTFGINSHDTLQIQELARKAEVTPFMVFFALFNILLARLSGENDVVVGVPVAGRSSHEIANTVGMFVNTLAFRNYPVDDKDFHTFLQEVKFTALAGFDRQDYQFEMLVDKLKLPRTLNRNPLFDTMFLYQNRSIGEVVFGDIKFIPYKYQSKVAHFDLLFTVLQDESTFAFDLEYNTELFTLGTVQRFAQYFQAILVQCISNPSSQLGQLEILTEKEKATLLNCFNDPTPLPRETNTVHQLFEAQVRNNPDAVAVVFEGKKLTYGELNGAANSLGQFLRGKGAGPDKIIGIMSEPSLEMVIGILAILKAGGAYLPIDPNYPAERIKYMVEDSGIQILLTSLTEMLRPEGIQVAEVIDLLNMNYDYKAPDLPPISSAENLVYLIYTSGSTGRPKGAMLEHRNLVNLLRYQLTQTNIDTSGKVLQFTTISFDVSFQEIFSTLLAQGELYLLKKEIKDNLSLLLEFISTNEIRTLFMPVAFLRLLFSDQDYIANISKSVKHIIIAGEQLIIDERIREYVKAHGVYVHNHYGPSETHVVTTLTLEPDSVIPEIPTIGKPLTHTQIYIVSKSGQLQPIGVPGELWIGGANVGRGYHNQPELTQEKFISNPFGHGRLYKTGDLARWRADGEIEFFGRIDHQVKIRGFRIELGEIEAQLLEHPSVKAGVVVARAEVDDNKYLVCYYTGDRMIQDIEVKEFLQERLPDYMVPAFFMQLGELPLTPSGKVDRKSLPEVDVTQRRVREFQAPRTELEKRLTEIWAELLKVECVGIEDDFFELGGHSLKATALAAKMYKELEVNIPLRQIFQTPTIKGLAEVIAEQGKQSYKQIELVGVQEYYPVSSAQKRLLLLEQIEGVNTAYNMPAAFHVRGPLDIAKLQWVFQQLIQRHEALRTSFTFIEGEPVQRVHDSVDFAIDYQGLANLGTDDGGETLTRISSLLNTLIQPFELAKAPLLKVGLIRISEEDHILFFDMHHIISDGTTLTIITQELAQLYNDKELSPLRIQYKDYANWQNQLLTSPTMVQQESYWVEQFAGEIPVLNLPTDYQRPKRVDYRGDRVELVLDRLITEQVNQFCIAENVTLFMFLLAVYNALLYKYTSQEEIVIGSPIAGREHPDLENIVGMFVNTLAFRNTPMGSKSFKDFLAEVKDNSLHAYEHQDYPFEMLVDRLNLPRSLNRNPLFDVMFVLLNMEQPVFHAASLTFEPLPIKNQTAKFDLLLQGVAVEDELHFSLEYRSDLFKVETIERMVQHFQRLLLNILSHPEVRLVDVEMMTSAEKVLILEKFNNFAETRPRGKTVLHLFMEQVKKAPEKVAVVLDNRELTYGELNGAANSLARHLRKMGAGSAQIIGLMAKPSMEMIIGILGILKSGGAYLPIDPGYPKERIEYMVEDSGISILLTSLREMVTPDFHFTGELVDLTRLEFAVETPDLPMEIDESNLVYLIYTSGSTGRPKGTMLEHGNLVNLLNFQLSETNIDTTGKVLQFTTISFDVSFQEIFSTFAAGGELHLLPKMVKDNLALFLDFIESRQIRTIFMPVAFLRLLFSEQSYIDKLPESLRHIVVAGEQLIVDERVREYIQSKEMYLHNHYGPSETHVVTTLTLEPGSEIPEIPSIGKPISHTAIYIVNAVEQLQPIGVPGELWIGGANVGRGYWKRPELTQEKFVSNPFGAGRVYKTGDLAKWRADGELEFLGRIDQQVKIRGFRIELGEIEAQLLEYPGVKAVAVIAHEEVGGGKYLIAYVEGEVTEGELKTHLADRLPDYMVPAYFVELPKLPLTPSGKVDRKALPTIDLTIRTIGEFQPPTNVVEEKLARIWSEVLKVQPIGIQEDFFELGGHSLRATAVVAKIYQELQVNIPLRQIFQTPTIKSLAEVIGKEQSGRFQRIEKAPIQEYYPVSSAQKRLLILQQMEGESVTYNIPGLLSIEGKLDVEQVNIAIHKLIERHQILRTAFTYHDGEPVQRVVEKVQYKVEVQNLSRGGVDDAKVQDWVRAFQRPFDLGVAPLLRVGLFKLAEERFLLIFDLHHLIADGTSLTIIADEFTQLYSGKELAPLRIHYQDFTLWQNALLESADFKKQEEYWLSKFADEAPVLNLPTDYPRRSVRGFAGAAIDFTLDADLTGKLKDLAQENGATLYQILVAVYNVLLFKYSGEEDIVLGSPIAGRTHPDLENCIGMFVNTLAIRNYPQGELTFAEFLHNVRDNILQDFEHQDYQFEQLVERLNLKRDLSRNPLFDTMLILQNYDTPEFTGAGLKIRPENVEVRVSKFDLTLNLYETDGKLVGQLEYSTDLFKPETIERLLGHLRTLIRHAVNAPQAKLTELSILTVEEEKRLIYEWNQQSKRDYPQDVTIHQLFTLQVAKTPNALAIVHHGQALTYRKFNEKVNGLAHTLRQKGVTRGQIVAVLAQQSIERVCAILAVLKAGGAYLPIDPEYPEARVEYLLKDSGSVLLLTDATGVQPDFLPVVDLSDALNYPAGVEEPANLNEPNDLAYIIYTSGTTGTPKGVMVEHQGVVNLVNWFGQHYDLKRYSRILQLTNFTFDPSVEQIFGALTNGATLYLAEKDLLLNKDAFISYLHTHQIQMADFVPAVLREILLDQPKIPSLEILISGGERLDDPLKDELRAKGYRVFNHYGPTEVTVQALVEECLDGAVTIGRPIANTQCYVVNRYLQPVPVGVSGELCLSGVGVARGYQNLAAETGERFSDNPFEPGIRLYRTGDKVRWLVDGRIEYLGRMDEQLKIRGFRVEPAEVERIILESPEVLGAAVIAKGEDTNRQLWGYIETVEGSFDLQGLKGHLAGRLPYYMVPAHFVIMEQLPLTANGKVDRKALANIGDSLEPNYLAPTNLVEENLMNLWVEVLGVGQIGIRDNFFEVGGHSLKAAQLISRIYQELQVSLALQDIFTLPTIQGLAEKIAGLKKESYEVLQPTPVQEFYPVSRAQRRMYFLDKMGVGTTYNMPGVVVVEGELNLRRLESAFTQLIQRHEALRTSFELINGEPVQKIREGVEFALIDLGEARANEVEQKILGFVQPFDLRVTPLLRVAQLELAKEKNLLIFDMHHIISDGKSMELLVSEVFQLYRGDDLPPLSLQYKDYAVWQNRYLMSDARLKDEMYWQERFRGQLPLLNLPTDYVRPTQLTYKGGQFTFSLEQSLGDELKKLARTVDATIFMVLLAVYKLLLFRYSGQEDLIVGTPTAGRSRSEFNQMIGLFVNTLALRTNPKSDLAFANYLEQVKHETVSALNHENYQFEELVELLDVQRDLSRNPLFDVMFVLQNSGDVAKRLEEAEQGFKVTPYPFENPTAKFDLTLNVMESDDIFSCNIEYRVDLFNRGTIERMAQHLVNLLRQVVLNPHNMLGYIPILSEAEKVQIIEEFNQTKANYPKDKVIHQIFEEQAMRVPDEVAVSCDTESITYGELNRRANQLAQLLRNKGVKGDTLVGMMANRSLGLLVGILGILKAGGAYVPIDPAFPHERIEYMVQDSKIGILITEDSLPVGMEFAGEIINLSSEQVLQQSTDNLSLINQPNDLAYIIYTSGSTGKPKGVMIEHRHVVRLLFNDRFQFAFSDADIWTMFHSPCFDFSVWEMYGALFYGGRLVVVPKLIAQNPAQFLQLLKRERVTVLNQTPTAFYNLTKLEVELAEHDLQLRYVIFAGEALQPTALKGWKDKYPETKLINMYGITETTVHVTYKEITLEEIDKGISNIGKPLPTLSVHILDQNLQLVPIGVPGEICVSGIGVARGYLNRAELTAEKFIQNPYNPTEVLYRSGDLARYLVDGDMEYLGRIDRQVKIRGFRIELGEIENQLLRYPAVENAVVIDKEDTNGDKYLLAYYVPKQVHGVWVELSQNELRAYLADLLPDYMIPAHLLRLTEIPLTTNGKVDRKALPEPDDARDGEVEYVAPRNELEARLVTIWSEVLGKGQIGVTDHFFEIGGHSLKATAVLARIQLEFGVELSLSLIFKNPTIMALGAEIAATAEHCNAMLQTAALTQGDLEVGTSTQPGIASDAPFENVLGNATSKATENTARNVVNNEAKISTEQNSEITTSMRHGAEVAIDKPEVILKTSPRRSKITPVEPMEYYPVSSAQKRLYLLQQLEGVNTAYNMPAVVALEGILDRGRLDTVFRLLLERHESLRTSFVMVDGEPMQWVQAEVEFALSYAEATEAEVPDLVLKFIRPFDLAVAPLIRVGLLCIEEDQHLLLLDMHHIISDGRSMEILVDELFKLYHGEMLNPLAIQYKDFAAWQNSYLASVELQKAEKFWLKRFTDEVPILNMPTDYPRPTVMTYEGEQYGFRLSAELSAKLRTMAKEQDATLYMVLLASYTLLLARYSGQSDIVVGSPVAGRGLMELEQVIGVFVNTLAMRNRVEVEQGFGEWLARVKEETIAAFDHQNYQFEMLVDKLALKRDLSRNALFDTMFVMQTEQVFTESSAGLKITPFPVENHVAKFDLTLSVADGKEGVACNLEYRVDLFKRETIARMAEHFTNLLGELVQNPQIKLREIAMISPLEREEILYHFNATAEPKLLTGKTLGEIFAEQVQRTPDQIAAVYQDTLLTYGELNKKANQLARVLREKGILFDEIVAISVERSLEMLIGIMAIIKAGAAYLPIDPTNPVERIRFMLEDSQSKLILTQSNLLTGSNLPQEMLDLTDARFYQGDSTDLVSIGTAEDLAYVIYTSGSTGKPKGVMVEHRGIINRLYWMQKFAPLGSTDTVLQKTTFTFDVSVPELFGWMIAGARVALLEPGGEKEPSTIIKAVKRYQITSIHFVPSMLTAFLEYLKGQSDLSGLASIRQVLASGEALTVKQVETFYQYFNREQTRLYNLYGPTEASVEVSYFDCTEMRGYSTVPIGKPISNIELYVLDAENRVQPIGVPGELHIAGVGLARGYLNRPDLTAEKFVPNPFKLGEKMYKTGDLVRWLADGNIEFLGRIDQQVKIRGFRLELGEIEVQLLTHAKVKEAVVVARKDVSGDAYLSAYFTSTEVLSNSDLQEYLAKRLPQYMVPTYFMQLSELPLTSSGKVDRKALPEPEIVQKDYIAPETELEMKLADIWAEILGVEQVGRRDNFFELGGHSLKATTMVGKIFRELDIEVPLREVFKSPILQEMSALLEGLKVAKNTEVTYRPITRVEEREYYPVSSGQKRMYMLQQFDLEGTGYNMPYVLEVSGRFDLAQAELALNQLIQRHESLRTSFTTVGSEIVQRIAPVVELSIELLATPDGDMEEWLQRIIRPFDLNIAPLLRVLVVRLEADRHLLIFDMHHIISDGVSMGIMIREFAQVYRGESLPSLDIQYRDYTAWLGEMTASPEFARKAEYWVQRFSGDVSVLQLPTDYPRPTLQNFAGDHISFNFTTELTERLKNLAENTGSTLYMVLLAGLNILFARYTGQTDIVVGSPIAGRPHPDLDNLIGIFVNTLAMRNLVEKRQTFSEFLQEVKENALQAYEHQEYPFEELVDRLSTQRDLSRNPLFDVMFTMQNIGLTEFELPELVFKPYTYKTRTAKFDLTVTAFEENGQLTFDFEYSTSLFKAQRMERMVTHFNQLFAEVALNPEVRVGQIQLLSAEEREEILTVFNDTKADYPAEKTVHELFAEQVRRMPDAVAVLCEEEYLTYRELDEKANQLARRLREKGIQSGSIVGIYLERSLEMIIGLFGILKAGGAYLPIVPEYPEERVRFMLSDSNVQIILTQSKWMHTVEFGGEWLDLQNSRNYLEDGSELESVNSSRDLIYIIYTSGSTGQPKGVMVEHHSVINRLHWMKLTYPVTEEDTIMQKTPFTFDVSVWELFFWPLQGAKLCLLTPGGEKDPEVIIHTIEKYQISYIHFVPTMLNIFLEYLKGRPQLERLKSLRRVFASGEALTVKQVDDFNELLYYTNGVTLHNMYGPTEATVEVSYYDCVPERGWNTIPIGKPISNTRLYVLDESNNLQPIGVPGELCIAGVNLARGYVNRRELTAEKFVYLPTGERIYRTGDLVSWLPDGNIQYLGRIDQQVKIRGFRIELGEIESCVLKYPGVQETIVIDRVDSSGDRYLCAYLVSAEVINVEGLREFLLQYLPQYMVPQHFLQIGEIPVNANGKADRKRLPEPELAQSEGGYRPPVSTTEVKLAGIWSELLGMERVSATDSFFTLGGHSIKAALLVSKIQKEWKVEIPLREIFTKPTIRELAQYIDNAEHSSFRAIVPVEPMDAYPLSSAQRRVYLTWQLNPESISYNMPTVLVLTGRLDMVRLQQAINGLLQRHEVLRTYFAWQDGEVVQKILPQVELQLSVLQWDELALPTGPAAEVSGMAIQAVLQKVSHSGEGSEWRTDRHSEEPVEKMGAVRQGVHEIDQSLHGLITKLIQPFDLSKAPLLRVALLRLGEDRHLLVFDVHHIISDGVSMIILTRDFIHLYEGKELPKLRVQYKDYAHWHNSLMGNGRMEMLREYWLNKLRGFVYTDLPRRVMADDSAGKVKYLELDSALTERIREFTEMHNITMFTFTLAVFKIILAKAINQNDLTIGLPVAGRNNEELENMLGLFLNLVLIRTQLDRSMTFSEYLYGVRDQLVEAQEYQDYPYEELYTQLKDELALRHNSLFGILFNYLPVQEKTQLTLSGLMVEPYPLDEVESKYSLTLYANESVDKLILSAVFKEYLEEELIEKILQSFPVVMEQILASKEMLIQQMSLSREEQTNQFAEGFEEFEFDNDDFFN